MRISGSTQIMGIFGDPIEHTFSPRMHNAAFEHLNLDGVYIPFHVTADRLQTAVRALPALNIRGINVTIPHKKAIVEFLDEYLVFSQKRYIYSTLLGARLPYMNLAILKL